MFIAMNRFQVKKGSEPSFETVFEVCTANFCPTCEALSDTFAGIRPSDVPGFIEFHLVKGPEAEDHTLYATHTVWADRAAFEAWTRSEAFRKAHSRAGNETGGSLYLGHPKFEGFEVLQTERAPGVGA